ncbi:MAG TPA: DUF2252 family protein [Candidatus Dormibacteraeota bacterium]|nr:DUF2252 family protein [Candidatus Dormibacteraeota bacterium]
MAATSEIVESTRSFERWLKGNTRLRQHELDYKHEIMAADTFSFLRATFYRWAQLAPQALPELAEAVRVLAVGDLHVENFGTWRDLEGRLVWGVNDFDEAYRMPFTFDLVRLATSAGLAAAEGQLNIDLKQACAAIIAGYTGALRSGGRAMVLAENDRWLRKLATGRLRDPVAFWARMKALPAARGSSPANLKALLVDRLPDGSAHVRFVRRRSGLGSLGRERLVAMAEWQGSAVAHEAKALAPSAWEWAHREHASSRVFYLDLVAAAVRSPDPLTEVRDGWLVRRLSPDCSRIELASLPAQRDEGRLLRAMGWEAGNIHLGTRGAGKAVLADLKRRKPAWLREAATMMGRLVRDDWKEWRTARS